MRLVDGSDKTVNVIWFWCEPGAQALPYSRFGSGNWSSDPIWPWEGVGEVKGAPRTYYSGKNPWGLDGSHHCGSDREFAQGLVAWPAPEEWHWCCCPYASLPRLGLQTQRSAAEEFPFAGYSPALPLQAEQSRIALGLAPRALAAWRPEPYGPQALPLLPSETHVSFHDLGLAPAAVFLGPAVQDSGFGSSQALAQPSGPVTAVGYSLAGQIPAALPFVALPPHVSFFDLGLVPSAKALPTSSGSLVALREIPVSSPILSLQPASLSYQLQACPSGGSSVRGYQLASYSQTVSLRLRSEPCLCLVPQANAQLLKSRSGDVSGEVSGGGSLPVGVSSAYGATVALTFRSEPCLCLVPQANAQLLKSRSGDVSGEISGGGSLPVGSSIPDVVGVSGSGPAVAGTFRSSPVLSLNPDAVVAFDANNLPDVSGGSSRGSSVVVGVPCVCCPDGAPADMCMAFSGAVVGGGDLHQTTPTSWVGLGRIEYCGQVDTINPLGLACNVDGTFTVYQGFGMAGDVSGKAMSCNPFVLMLSGKTAGLTCGGQDYFVRVTGGKCGG